MTNVEIAYKISAPNDVPAAYALGLGGCADNLFTLEVFTVAPTGDDIRVLTLVSA